ncbi:MAG: hypothetical protein AAF990_13490 [Bacteroidota bacterium]
MKTSKRERLKKVAIAMAALIMVQAILPSYAMALTSGPTQPEFQGFQQAGTSDMVDLFTGNFSYNIPLMDVGGYPLNLSYSSDPRMDDEASWVGLGWSLNPGLINRTLRGLPDDFMGDPLEREMNMSPDVTVGVGAAPSLEVIGLPVGSSFGYKIGLLFNNKRGFEMSTSFDAGISLGIPNARLTAGLGLAFSPSAGLDIGPTIGLSSRLSNDINGQLNVNGGLNSRAGLKALTFQGGGSVMLKTYETEHVSTTSTIGFGKHSSYSFGPFSYAPISTLPIKNTSFQFSASAGLEAFPGVHPNIKINGFWTQQKLEYQKESQRAFGYCYLDKLEADDKALMDYNSELNGQFNVNQPHVPLAYGTYDVFHILGQGIGGQFRAMRNDLGIFRPALEVNKGIAGSLGVELGVPAYTHLGADVTGTLVESRKTVWQKDKNRLTPHMRFTSPNQDYEPFYFKTSEEQVALSEEMYAETGKDEAVRVRNIKEGTQPIADNRLETAPVNRNATTKPVTPSGSIQNTQRAKRNQVVSYLTVEEAMAAGLDKKIRSYPKDTMIYADCNLSLIKEYERTGSTDAPRPLHHISEMTVTQGNGARYVFGLPAYNNLQRDVSFSVNENFVTANVNDQNSSEYGLVAYERGKDNTVKNENGPDHVFDATNMPPYAHSFLLTGVLSPDYVDRTGDGITDDDTGNAIKFNYHRWKENFQWRIPTQFERARYHEGNKATKDDDKASYVYGQKEIWYAHSIESRTMLAQFYLSDREDALGVIDENGGRDVNSRLQKLDKIELYSKAELRAKGADAVPIKTVHFEYKSSLCKGVSNHVTNGQGKLTLDKIYFTYGNSDRGKLNAYTFSYKEKDVDDQPFDYNIGHYDRWGLFKKNPTGYPPAHEYPYVIQKEDGQNSTDVYTQKVAGAWNLEKIELPSGGTIEVDYESDDYAYVQDKRAGQMMEVLGFANGAVSYDTNLYADEKNLKQYIVVRLPQAVNSLSEAQKRYMEGIDQVYFDCLVDMAKGNYERIKGYFQIDPSKPILLSANKERLLIPFKYLKDKRNNDIPPITFAAIQKMRLQFPELFYPGYRSNLSPKVAINALVGLINEMKNTLKGVYFNSMIKGWGRQVDTSNKSSWVRLCNPDFKKLGGGTRVKEIRLKDNWIIANGGGSSDYGQSYSYTKTKTIEGQQIEISSGVASYEPGIGGEENMMREALPYEEKRLLAPKNEFYSETPIGESLFPAPVVGYSQVKVTDIANRVPGLNRTASGYTVHEFYTAKDFPTKVSQTLKSPQRHQDKLLKKIFRITSWDAYSVTQGYVVELNDMHGKGKAQTIFDKNDAQISAVNYYYKSENKLSENDRLINDVSVLLPDGTISNAKVGLEMDIWQEMVEEHNLSETHGTAFNTDVFVTPLFGIPGALANALLKAKKENTLFRAAVTTKLFKRSALLDRVVAVENGSSVTTKNILWDGETGEVLLTETSNEFDDPMYSFTYPAHWAYERMGQAYKNIGAVFNNVNLAAGYFTNLNANAFFHPGDELWISGQNKKYFVTKPATDLVVLDENGAAPPTLSGVTVKIIRSGIRNQASVPIGQIHSRKSPINSSNNTFEPATSTGVLDASAVTFSEEWKIECGRELAKDGGYFLEETFNPYTAGMFGNWRPSASYIYYDKRVPNRLNTLSTNYGMTIRNNGQSQSFDPFWTYDQAQSKWTEKTSSDPKWPLTNRITQYDVKGNELENQDALGISSAAYFSYRRSLPIAVANNATYQEIFYDGIEDYIFDNDCEVSNGFQRNLTLYDDLNQYPNLIDDVAHTGRYSLGFPAGTDQSYSINVNDNCTSVQVRANLQDSDRLNMQDPKELQSFRENRLNAATGDNCYSVMDATAPPVYFENKCCACLPILSPVAYQSYHVSAWVASDSSLFCGVPPNHAFIEVSGVLQGPVLFRAAGPVIDGWQRVEGKIEAAGNAETMTIRLGNDGSTVDAYFDDFRFHPWQSNMQSYVYDPFSLRLMATLDQNNYASFYEYDDEGLLVRTKRETEKGIVTLQEGRTVLKSNN